MAQELHLLGYENLEVMPSLLPEGNFWRCSFYNKTNKAEVLVSPWIYQLEELYPNEEIDFTPQELADLFITMNPSFVAECIGENKVYNLWYAKMLKQLAEDELPYAFSDFFSSKTHWKTNKDRLILKWDVQ